MIELHENAEPRPDLDARVETKYIFRAADIASLRATLLRRGRRISHAGPVSTVFSLYFDDDRLGCCRANLDGAGLRHKTRLRWYDREMPGRGAIFFETKWRRHRLTGKRRLGFSSTRPFEESSFERMRDGLRRTLPFERHDHLDHDTQAVALIRYRREHFLVDGTDARLTLDYDIRFSSQLGRRRLAQGFEERLPDVALIELKTPPGQEHLGAELLRPLRARPGRFSKYVAACQSLGIARGF